MQIFVCLFLIVLSGCGGKSAPDPDPNPNSNPVPQTCASGTDESDCPKKAAQEYCEWNPSADKGQGVCLAILKCSDASTESDCDFVSGALKCAWDEVQNSCDAVGTECGQITIANTCNISGLGCFWYGASNTCQDITACHEATSETNCSSTRVNKGLNCQWCASSNSCHNVTSCETALCQSVCAQAAGGDCYWNGTQCAAPQTCTEIAKQSICQTATLPGTGCAWSGTCTNATTCVDIKNETACNQSTIPKGCFWTSSTGQCAAPISCVQENIKANCLASPLPCAWGTICTDATQCSQINNQTACSGSSLQGGCLWNGAACVAGVCSVKSGLPACETFDNNETGCVSNGCSWAPDAACNSQTAQSSCTSPGCTWCQSQSVQSSDSCPVGCSSRDCFGYTTTTCATSSGGLCKLYDSVCAPTVDGNNRYACAGNCVGATTGGTCSNPASSGRNACKTYTTQTTCTPSYCQWGIGGQ